MSAYKTGIVQIGTFDAPIDWDGGAGDNFVWTHNLGKYPLSVSLFSARAGSQGTPILNTFAVTSTLNSIQVERPAAPLPIDTEVICLITFEVATPQNAGQIPLSDVVQS